MHTIDSVDNLSDHLPLSFELNVDVDYVNVVRAMRSAPRWGDATEEHHEAYRDALDSELSTIEVPLEAVRCTDMLCNKQSHSDALKAYHNGLVEACLRAADQTIPCTSAGGSSRRRGAIPGWNEHIRPLKDDALFWHYIWKENGRPQTGIIADIRRRTRARYHGMLRRLTKNEGIMRKIKMAENFIASNRKEFWTEVKKMKGGTGNTPACIDGSHGDDSIAQVFGQKYEQLFNSVQYDEDEINDF